MPSHGCTVRCAYHHASIACQMVAVYLLTPDRCQQRSSPAPVMVHPEPLHVLVSCSASNPMWACPRPPHLSIAGCCGCGCSCRLGFPGVVLAEELPLSSNLRVCMDWNGVSTTVISRLTKHIVFLNHATITVTPHLLCSDVVALCLGQGPCPHTSSCCSQHCECQGLC